MNRQIVILGAGPTGLAAGIASQAQVYEASNIPGGICATYYMKPHARIRSMERSENQEDYRFEYGGGHWIYGGDSVVLDFLSKYDQLIEYERKSAVFLQKHSLLVPYPIQNNTASLPKAITDRIVIEQELQKNKTIITLKEWLQVSFGQTLCDLFFFPFHKLYTAGLWETVVPQDQYKTPRSLQVNKTRAGGYNDIFIYPKYGLGKIFQGLASRLDVRYQHQVRSINLDEKKIDFQNGRQCTYERVISTIPLKRMVEICGIQVSSQPDPYTSVLVLNVGAKIGINCPDHHWLYIPESLSGFYRVGFYSNVNESFLPAGTRGKKTNVSVYIEKAYLGGIKPSESEIDAFSKSAISELQKWGFIGNVEIVDHTWIEYAYTWLYPDSQWRTEAISKLEQRDIYQVGRYGRWQFQGIAASIREGMDIGNHLRRH